MKHSLAISLLLMSSTQSRHVREMLQLNSELQITENMNINLGSLEGAYLSQKMKKKEGQGSIHWDQNILGLVDPENYQSGDSEEKHVDTEFATPQVLTESEKKITINPMAEAPKPEVSQDDKVSKGKAPKSIGKLIAGNANQLEMAQSEEQDQQVQEEKEVSQEDKDSESRGFIKLETPDAESNSNSISTPEKLPQKLQQMIKKESEKIVSTTKAVKSSKEYTEKIKDETTAKKHDTSKFDDEVKQNELMDKLKYQQGPEGVVEIRHESPNNSDKEMIEEESQEYLSHYFAEKDSEVAKLKKIELDAQEKLLKIQQLELAQREKDMKETNHKIAFMKKEWKNFCQTLELEHWDKAQKTWTQLDQGGNSQPILKANTRNLYQSSFTFGDIGKNDNVINILSDLEIAEGNLNANPDHEGLLQTYITTAQKAGKELQKTYPEFWTNPGAALVKTEKQQE